MKELFKFLYRFKIKVMFYFGLGFAEVSNLVSLTKDIAIILGFLVLVFKWHIGIKETVLLAVGSFLGFVALGIILKESGMSDYATRMSNSINPELKLIRKIAKHLNIEE